MRISLRLFLVAFCAVGGLTIPVLARCEEPPLPPKKPPLTKEQERQKFHPKTQGMDAAVRLEGFRKRIEMERTSPVAGISFRGVGPEIQGGRIVDIEAPAKLPDSLFVAFASGGLWRTDNRGGSWTPLFDNESSITIGDIALADPEGKTIYVGTGENNSSRSSYSGTGIFKTTDGGKTWKNVGLADSHHIGQILVDPRDSRVVYVASMGHLYTEDGQRGVFKSTDAGATWTLLLSVPDRTGVIDLAADPSRPDVLYAATWERARTAANFLESGPGSGIWKSTDGGSSWKRLANGLPAGAAVGRIGLAVAASRPDTVYAVLDNQARRPESEILDEETPPGELTPRRLRRLDAEGFARLDEGVIRRFLKRFDFPKDLKAPRLKKDVAAGKISIADLVAYLEDANRDLFENEVIGPEVYRSDDRGGTWKRTHEGRIENLAAFQLALVLIADGGALRTPGHQGLAEIVVCRSSRASSAGGRGVCCPGRPRLQHLQTFEAGLSACPRHGGEGDRQPGQHIESIEPIEDLEVFAVRSVRDEVRRCPRRPRMAALLGGRDQEGSRPPDP